jgi:hypothetical protein
VNLLSKLLDGGGAVASRPVAAVEEGEGDPEVQDIVAKVSLVNRILLPSFLSHRLHRLEIGLKPLIPLDCGPRGTVMPSPHDVCTPLC